jgi:hypothetical protein
VEAEHEVRVFSSCVGVRRAPQAAWWCGVDGEGLGLGLLCSWSLLPYLLESSAGFNFAPSGGRRPPEPLQGATKADMTQAPTYSHGQAHWTRRACSVCMCVWWAGGGVQLTSQHITHAGGVVASCVCMWGSIFPTQLPVSSSDPSLMPPC